MRKLAWSPATGYATVGMLIPFLGAVLLRPRVPDDALVRRIAQGDAPALRELYDRCAQVALALGVSIGARATCHRLSAEALAVARAGWKPIGREDLDGGHGTPQRGGGRTNHRTGRQGFALQEVTRLR